MGMTKRIRWVALDMRVIAVAVEGEVGDWAAYIGCVPGNNHESEVGGVALRGTKLPRRFAEVLFPDFTHLDWRP